MRFGFGPGLVPPPPYHRTPPPRRPAESSLASLPHDHHHTPPLRAQGPIIFQDGLTGAPADHGVRGGGLAPPSDADESEGEGGEGGGGAPGALPADHVEIEKSNVLILVRA